MKFFDVSALALTTALTLALAGCGGSTSEDDGGETAGNTPAETTGAAIPASLFASAAPADAVPLIEAKTDAKQGDRVVFEARVGGRVESFVENRAMFLVTDSELLSCDQIPGDNCKTPWDYCCEPKDNLLKHMATVQVVGDDGKPLPVSLHHENGLEELRTVFVTGVIDQIDESGTCVINAESIYVQEG